MSKYIAVIPRAGITRLTLVEAKGRSMAQVKEAAGCDYIINSWFYSMTTGRPVGNLCIDGVVKTSAGWAGYYKVTADAFVGAARPVEVCGLCVFDKRVILFGSEGSAKVFTSDARHGGEEESADRANLPTAVVEAVDPIVLNMKLVDVCECRPCDCELTELPPCVCACFGCDLCFGSDGKRIYVTLGQFSIVRLERDAQLLMPVYDYCMPEKECTCGGCEDDPCEIFRHVKFPVNEFFPPNSPAPIPDNCRDLKSCCG